MTQLYFFLNDTSCKVVLADRKKSDMIAKLTHWIEQVTHDAELLQRPGFESAPGYFLSAFSQLSS